MSAKTIRVPNDNRNVSFRNKLWEAYNTFYIIKVK